MADLHPDSAYAPERFADPQKALEFPPEAENTFRFLLTRYPTKTAALLPVLHLAQEVWGWISPEVVLYFGGRLGLAPSTVFGVVSFYNMYNQKPVGKYFLQVCRVELRCGDRGRSSMRRGLFRFGNFRNRGGIGDSIDGRDLLRRDLDVIFRAKVEARMILHDLMMIARHGRPIAEGDLLCCAEAGRGKSCHGEGRQDEKSSAHDAQ